MSVSLQIVLSLLGLGKSLAAPATLADQRELLPIDGIKLPETVMWQA
jgi:hypothetical protein